MLWELHNALDHDSCQSLVISDTQVNTKTTAVKFWSHWGVSSLVLNCGTPAWTAAESTQIVLWELNTALDHDSLCSLVISDTQVNTQASLRTTVEQK